MSNSPTSLHTSKIAIIFGAAGNIGSHVSRRLASYGATVFLFGLTLSKLEKLAVEINNDHTEYEAPHGENAGTEGGVEGDRQGVPIQRAIAREVDAMDRIAVDEAFQFVLLHPATIATASSSASLGISAGPSQNHPRARDEAHGRGRGRIDIIVNAIQLQPVQGTPLLEMNVSDVLHPVHRAVTLTLNIARGCKASASVVPSKKTTSETVAGDSAAKESEHQPEHQHGRDRDRDRGVLITFSTTASKLSGRDRRYHQTGGFSSACAAVEQLTYGLAAELGQRGGSAGERAWRVICLRPDAIPQTWEPDAGEGSELLKYMSDGNALGEMPTLEGVSEMICWLVSERMAGGVSGTVINLSGGSVME